MKKLFTIYLLIACCITLTGFSQTLSGEYSNDGSSTPSYYTKIKWEVSYTFIEKNGLFYIKFYNPKIKVPNYALYHDEFGKEYSLADLNLGVWPAARQLPFVMGVTVNISDGYNNYESTSSCNSDFTCNENYIAAKANLKNVGIGNFRVTSVSYFHANLGGEPAVDAILKNKRQSGNKSTNASSNTTASSSTSTENTNSNSISETPVYTPTYTKQDVTNQVINQAATLAGGLINDWNASYERKEARRKSEQKFKEENNAKNYEEKFKTEYLPLMDRALKGDEEAKMILYFTSDTEKCWDYVPLRWEWFDEALENNNTDALLEKAVITFKDIMYKKEVKNDFIFYLKKAIDLGNVDAMILMASSYSSYTQTPNAKEAFELYTKAAEKGSPIAMYRLGMIYKYGYCINATKYDKPYFAKFDVQLDEKEALEWFLKSYDTFLKPSYQESTFAKSIKYNEGGFFGPVANYDSLKGCFRELSIIYKEGKVVSKDKNKAKEYEILANSVYSKRNFQKFNLEWEN